MPNASAKSTANGQLDQRLPDEPEKQERDRYDDRYDSQPSKVCSLHPADASSDVSTRSSDIAATMPTDARPSIAPDATQP